MYRYRQNSEIDQLMRNGVVKQHFKWDITFSQHPMYLLVDEDRGEPVVGERLEPWGAPDTDIYVDRIRRNLQALERYEEFCLNYEFSAVEIMELVEKYPDIYETMKRLYACGKLSFVNGSYSQPHLQNYDSEITWRQFEYGLEVYRKYFGANIKVYAMQETSLHPQIPQVIRKFGYDFMNVPCFPWAMEVVEGTIDLQGQCDGLDTTRGEDFISAVSPDGTTIPAYIKTVDYISGKTEKEDINKDLFSGPVIWSFMPDLIEVNEEFYEQIRAAFHFRLMEDAFRSRYEKVRPRAKAVFYTDWSYSEGIWGEALVRSNKRAEEKLLTLETLSAAASRQGMDTEEVDRFVREGIRQVLKYEHHDVSWIEVTDLRRKAIRYMNDICDAVPAQYRDLVLRLCGRGDRNALINTWGLPLSVGIVTKDRSKVPAGSASQRIGDTYISELSVPGGRICSYMPTAQEPEQVRPFFGRVLKTDYAEFTLSESCLFEKIVTTGGRTVCLASEYLGGELRAMMEDCVYSSSREFGGTVYEGGCAYVIRRRGQLQQLPIEEDYIVFKHRNEVKVTLTVHGNGCEIGKFWLDETKLNVYYPGCSETTWHDIPFGFQKSKESRVSFAPNWISNGGLTYVNKGTVKHWVRDGVMANVLVWSGTKFTNRVQFVGDSHHESWDENTQYDLTLKDTQVLEYSLVITESTDPSDIARAVELTRERPVVQGVSKDAGLFPQDRPDHASTAIFAREGKVFERGWKLPGGQEDGLRDFEIYTRERT